MTPRPTLYLTVGLPGAGKTTWATRTATEQSILRLTPDDWMAPLFRHNDADGRRDILEGRLLWVAREVVVSGASVVVDFGCWSPEERYAVRSLAEEAGATFVLEYLHVPEPERRRRAERRWRDAPETTFPMSDSDHDRFVEQCVPPSAAELEYAPIPAPPTGFDSWALWAAERWPTLGVADGSG